MRCPKCRTEIEVHLTEPGQLIICPACGIRLRPKQSPNNAQQIKRLLSEIAQVFPDGIVDMKRWEHEKWDDRIAQSCSQLGYTNVGAFLQAYGFRVRFEGHEEAGSHRNRAGLVAGIVIVALIIIAAGIFTFVGLFPKTEQGIISGNSQMLELNGTQSNNQSLEPQQSHSSTSVPNDKKYESVFDAYMDACSMGVNAYRENSWSQSRPSPYFPNCVEAISYGYYESGYPLYYAYYDVNEDGTDELFIGQSNGQIITLLDVYSYNGSEPVKLFPDIEFGSRTNLAVTEKHELVINGSSGADNPSAAYYCLSLGSCQPQFLYGYCAFSYADDYPEYTPVDISNWFDYVETTGIHAEFSWSSL